MKKLQIAYLLDKHVSVFNFTAKSGLTSYKNYTKSQLIKIANQFNINLKS